MKSIYNDFPAAYNSSPAVDGSFQFTNKQFPMKKTQIYFKSSLLLRGMMVAALLLCMTGFMKAQAAISVQNAWAQQYASTTYPSGAVNASYAIANGTNRLLVVAVATTRTAVGTMSCSVTYGGVSLTLAAGDAASTTTWNHSFLFYLKDSDIGSAAGGKSLNVTVTGGTSYYTYVGAAVYAGVDQTTPLTDAQNFNSNSTANADVGPINLDINANDQAIAVINLARSAVGKTARTITSWAVNWTTTELSQQYNPGGNTIIFQAYVSSRAVPTSNITNEAATHTASSANTFKSYTAMSLNAAPAPGDIITTTYSYTGSTQTFTVPNCVTSVTVEAWGGGGRGSTRTSNGAGAGGGGGAYAKGTVAVTPGNTYNYYVGAGSSTTSAGQDSYFNNTSTVLAKGGNSAADNSNTRVGGQAGSIGSDVVYSGGNSAAGANSNPNWYGGGGGSSGGTAANGNYTNQTTTSQTGGSVSGGGSGGNGGGYNANGSTGSVPGGGGGGAHRAFSNTTGGTGGNGQIIITYTLPNAPTITLGSNPSVCYGATSANLTYSATTGCPDKYSIDYNTAANTAGFIDVTDANLESSISLTIPANVAAAVYSGTLTVKNSTYNFTSITYSISVTVNPTNTAGQPSSNPILCINTAISPSVFIATTGATGIGTPAGLPNGVSASWASNRITISGTPSQSGTFNYSIPLTGGCGNVNATGTITVNPAGYWLGTTSAWETASNWCSNTVPTASTDVIIPAAAANKPQVNNGPSSPATCRNLTIESGATLTINAGGALTVEGTTTLNGSNCLIIKSVSAGETGSFISKGSVSGSGTAQIERYIDNSKSGWDWHMLSSPVTAQPIWPDILPAPDGSYYWGTGILDWDFYYWNPNTPNAYPHTPWVNIRKTDGYYNSGTFDDAGDAGGFGAAIPQMKPARGYLVGFNTNNPEVGVTKTFTGVPNTGTINDHVANKEDLYNLTGNPYPSSIDWRSSSLGRSNLDYTGSVYTYWVWNEDAGTYGAATSSQDEGTNGTSRYITPMQAFWVQAKDLSSSPRDLIAFSNDARVHSGQKYLKSTASTGNSLRLKLTTSANTYSDEMIVSFDPAFPGTGGAEKMFSMYSEAPEIYSWKNSKCFSIDMYPQVTEDFTVDLYTKNNVAGTYTITASNINDFVLSGLVILKNMATGEEYDLRQNHSYSFPIPANASSKAFQLIFRAPGYLNTLGTGSWNLPTTWLSNKVPAPTDNIIISHAVSVDNSPLATCNNLMMNNGGTLTVESGQALTVNGTLTSNSTSNVLVKSGGSLISNSPGVKATVKRDITGTVYHFVSAPVTGPALGSVFPLTTYVQQYDEPNQKWVNLTAADAMETGKGYSAYLEGTSAVECTFAGELNAGDVTISGLTKTGIANDDYNGWNLIGNPFTSAIDASSIGGWGLTNVDPFVYVWNGGNYLCHSVTIPGYASNTTGTMATPYVPAQQGFFVHVTDQTPPAATGSVTIPFTARVHSNQVYYKGTLALPNSLSLEVAGNGYSDKAMVYFTDEAAADYDVNYDAYKLSGLAEAPQLYSILTGRKLTINALQSPQTSSEVPLGFVAGAETSYTLTFTGMESFDASIPLRLDDLKTGLSRDLRTDPVYEFTATPGDDEHRFRLRFKSSTGFGEQESIKQVYIYTLEKDVYISANRLTIGTCEVYIYNAVGQKVYQGRFVPAAEDQKFARINTPGAYIVKVISATGTTTEKIIIP